MLSVTVENIIKSAIGTLLGQFTLLMSFFTSWKLVFMHLIGIVSLLVCMVLEKTMSVVTLGRYRPRRKNRKWKGVSCQSDRLRPSWDVKGPSGRSMHGSAV